MRGFSSNKCFVSLRSDWKNPVIKRFSSQGLDKTYEIDYINYSEYSRGEDFIKRN